MNPLDQRPDSDAIRAWLGPVELTDEQTERFLQVWDEVADIGPDTDQDAQNATLSAAVQYLLGETTPADAGHAITVARRQWTEATAAAAQIARMAHDDGATEAELARALGVDRPRTMRRWLRK